MLSPSRLFFGMPDDAEYEPPFLDEKPVWSGDVFRLLEDSDGEDQTDVPAGHSLGASLDDSDEERRAPPSDQRRPIHDVAPGMRRFELAQRLPPGLDASVEQESIARCPPTSRPPPPPGPVPPAPTGGAGGNGYGKGASVSDDDDSEEGADDEDYAHGSCPPPPGMDVANSAWYAELPSIGSANHFNGTCDRCCFHPKGRCLNGYNCQHCHFDHEKRKRKNKKKNKATKVASLGCGEDVADMVSTSAEGSVPVSPDKTFGAGMLPQSELAGSMHPDFAGSHHVDFPSAHHVEFLAATSGVMASGNTPEPCDSALRDYSQQSLYFQGASAPDNSVPSISSEPFLGANKWYSGPSTQLCSGSLATTPTMETSSELVAGWKGANYAEAAASQSFAGQPIAESMPVQPPDMKSGYLEEPDKRDEYIHQLEAENRYLRSCLLQCMGPGASAVLPPRGGTFSGPLGTAPPAGLPSPGSLSTVLGTPSSSDVALVPPVPALAQSLSPSAAPFWPAGQPWQELGNCYQAAETCSSLEPHRHSEAPACSSISAVSDDTLVSSTLA